MLLPVFPHSPTRSPVATRAPTSTPMLPWRRWHNAITASPQPIITWLPASAGHPSAILRR